MKFNLKVSRLNNLYFFVANLTEFHHSCRLDFNKEWLKKTGSLNRQEKKVLAELKRIFQKYGSTFKNNKSVYLGQYFYCPNDRDKWPAIRKYLSSLEYDKLYSGLTVLENRFNKIYREDLLKEWMISLEKELTIKRFSTLYSFIKRFFKPKKLEVVLNIHLLTSPSLVNTASGGANLGIKDITLEVPVFQLVDWQVEQAANVILHELAHIWFENSVGYQLIKKLKAFSLIKETIIQSIAPFGYPCQLYSDKVKPLSKFLWPNLAAGFQAHQNFKNGQEFDRRKLNFYLTWLAYPLVANYFLNDKKLDRRFIDSIIKLIQK